MKRDSLSHYGSAAWYNLSPASIGKINALFITRQRTIQGERRNLRPAITPKSCLFPHSLLRVSMDESLSDVNIGALLADMTGKDRVTGTLNAAAKFTGTGATPDAIKKTLSGNLALAFTDGAVKGVNLIRVVREAQAVLKGKPYTEKTQVEQTDFSTMSATANVNNGIIRNDDLDAKSPLLRVQGKGMVDLGRESINYLLTTTIVGSLEGQGGKEISELAGIPIPIEVNGTFSSPRYKPRLDVALKQVAGDKVKQAVEEKKGELKEKAQEKLQKQLDKRLDGKLKGLFN